METGAGAEEVVMWPPAGGVALALIEREAKQSDVML